MPQILEKWTVLPHGKLSSIGDGILTVTGTIHMPATDLERRMTVVRLRDGKLVIYSAIALDEQQMSELEAFGDPGFLIVPGDHHRLDAKVWKERYPGLRVIAPAGARAAVEQSVTVDADEVDFQDPDVRFMAVEGTEGHEAALLVRRATGTTLILNDLIGNMTSSSGIGGWLLRVMGYSGEAPQIPLYAKIKIVESKTALRRQLLAWAQQGVTQIVVSHGEPVTRDAPAVLRKLAASLE